MRIPKLTIVYGIGASAQTKEYELTSDLFLEPLKKQIKLSIPLITSISLKVPEDKHSLFSIYVGREFNMHYYEHNDFFKKYYDISPEDVLSLKMRGYQRFCLLNYKKYNQVVIGLRKQDKVVPDYFALKRNINKFKYL